MRKLLRKHIKEEKRIVRLLYRTGLIDKFRVKLVDLYWAEYKSSGKKKQKFTIHLPEVYYGSEPDYFGEYDEHGLVDGIIEYLYWEGMPLDDIEECELQHLKSSFIFKGRKWFIRYLKSLPVVRNDNKIRKYLTIKWE